MLSWQISTCFVSRSGHSVSVVRGGDYSDDHSVHVWPHVPLGHLPQRHLTRQPSHGQSFLT